MQSSELAGNVIGVHRIHGHLEGAQCGGILQAVMILVQRHECLQLLQRCLELDLLRMYTLQVFAMLRQGLLDGLLHLCRAALFPFVSSRMSVAHLGEFGHSVEDDNSFL